MELDELGGQAARCGTELVVHSSVGGKAHSPPGQPEPPAQVSFFEVGKEVGVEGADLSKCRAADQKSRAFRRKDLVRCVELLFGLARASMDQEAGRGEE